MRIIFLGAAGTVTGSKHLVRNNDEQILIDCGAYQGLKELRLKNWEEIPLEASKLKAVILTHAHLDHCGLLPRLIKQGFKGPIYCTTPTVELVRIILMDAAKIQMEDADYANKKKFSKHAPALPLYDIDDVEKTLPYLKAVEMKQKTSIGSFQFEFIPAGHILGAASVHLTCGNESVHFSGDLGRKSDPLMHAPEPPLPSDGIVMESTYGDRAHDKTSSAEQLTKYINKVWSNKSVLLIPAFALGRSQNLIYEIVQLKNKNLIPKDIPIYFNSPMGQEVCELYKNYPDYQKLRDGEFEQYMSQIRFVPTADDSRALNAQKGPMVIVAASGMLTGGRVLHHLKAFAGDGKNIILLAGFQSAGTRGWSLANGERKIKVHGQMVDVAAEVVVSDSFSSHADQPELLEWLQSASQPPQKVFLVHGEPASAEGLRNKIESELHLEVIIPQLEEGFEVQKSPQSPPSPTFGKPEFDRRSDTNQRESTPGGAT